MFKNLHHYLVKSIWIVVYLLLSTSVQAQFNLGKLGLGSLKLKNPTNLKFGPDGRVYVTQQDGTIYAFTLQRNGTAAYVATKTEVISLVKQITNHNDDTGEVGGSTGLRQVTGIIVAGTASNPVVYVSSSDDRIGGPSGDKNLDTNSGVITKLTWKGANAPANTDFTTLKDADLWEKVDLVRGLPRSEENHSVNGLRFVTINAKPYLLLSVGGMTNAGSPSQNFTKITEYALASSVLSIDLQAIEALPTLGSGINQYKYDIPTLDDPTRPNANGIVDPAAPGYDGIDVNDPWGGNDGLNQAMVVQGGPVQVFSPGYRNTYDLVVTENGRVYVTDNGANQGWGGLPFNEGPSVIENGVPVSKVTNQYNINDLGQELGSGQGNPPYNGQTINNKDHLHLVTGVGDIASKNINNYTFGSYYAGHPVPVRANPTGAGLYTHFGENTSNNSIFRTVKFNPNGSGDAADPDKALPANWPPVPAALANPVEGDFRNPGVDDGAILVWPNNTNAIEEYTASNFGGSLKGSLVAGTSNGGGKLFNVILNNDGTVATFNNNFANVGESYILGIECLGDAEVFPGTIWLASYGDQTITILEPNDYGGQVPEECLPSTDPAFDPLADSDNDGFSNQDELDNDTDHCSSALFPDDADGDKISDLNDPDDDNDGIVDHLDYFQRSKNNGLNNNLPVFLSLFNLDSGFYELGFTGMMTNKKPDDNYLNWLDDEAASNTDVDDIYGGAVGAVTVHWDSGDALGNLNSQKKGFQFGLQVGQGMPKFYVESRLLKPFKTPTNGESYGMFVGVGDQDNYIKIVRNAGGMQVVKEVAGQPEIFQFDLAIVPVNTLDLILIFDPTQLTVQPAYISDSKAIQNLGSPIQLTGELANLFIGQSNALAVGMIGTSGTNPEFAANYDFFKADLNVPGGNNAVQVLINAGGPEYTDNDGRLWSADQFFINGLTYPKTPSTIQILNTDNDGLYRTERYAQQGSFEYQIPLPDGAYTVKLHFAEIYWRIASLRGGPGFRIFDVQLEGSTVLRNYDILAKTQSATAIIESFNIELRDGVLNIKGISKVGDAKISAIEIISLDQPVAIQPIDNQFGIEGEEVSLSVVANGGKGNLRYSAIGLPNGLTIEPTNGLISGTIEPGTSGTNDGTYNVSVFVSDDNNTSSSSFIWKIFATFPDQWTAETTVNNHIKRHENAFVQLGDKFYLLGGRESNTIEIYDFENKTWTTGPEAPVQIHHFQPVVHKGMLWVMSSFSGNFPAEVPNPNIYIYDPTGNKWIVGPEIPADRRRGSAGTVVYNDKIYIFSGIKNGHIDGWEPWVDEYDPATNTWKILPDAPQARDHFFATVIGNKAYLAGGRRTGQTGTFAPMIAGVDVFDFDTKSWLTTSLPDPLPTLRAGAATVNFRNELVVIGGENADSLNALMSVEALNVQTGKWRRLANLINARHGTQAIVSGLGMHITAGSPKRGGGNQNNPEVYGINNPEGTVILPSTLTGITTVTIPNEPDTFNIRLSVAGGNQGIFIESIALSGTDADTFNLPNINSIINSVFAPDSSLLIAVGFVGTDFEAKSAQLTIKYNGGKEKTVDLFVPADRLPPIGTTFRLNVGGNAINAIEPGGAQWTADSRSTPSRYIVDGPISIFNKTTEPGGYPGAVDMTHPSLVGTNVPQALFNTERYDTDPKLPNLLWQFPLKAGTKVKLQLYFAEIYALIDAVGERVFDVSVEGAIPSNMNNIDQFAFAGPNRGFMLRTYVRVKEDGLLDIELLHAGADAPSLKGIDIVVVDTGNIPPLVDAGLDRLLKLPNNSAVINGNFSDEDGTIVSFGWTQVSGPTNATISGQNTTTISVSDLVAGEYVFRLEATDDLGTTGFDEVFITVNPPNVPPTANAGSNKTIRLPISEVTITGNASDPDGFVDFVEWTQLNGPKTATLSGADGEVLTASDLTTPGAYEFVFTVTDSDGAVDKDTMRVNVIPANVLPTVNAGTDISITLPVDSASTTATVSDTDGTIATFSWSQVSGPSGAILEGQNTASLKMSDLKEGVYIFRLTVTDNDGGTAFDDIQVTVIRINQPPVANAGEDQTIVLPINSTILEGSGSDPDGTVIEFTWEQVSGPSSATIFKETSTIITVSSLVEGTYVFRLTAKDNDNATTSDEVTVIVKPVPVAAPANVSATDDNQAEVIVTWGNVNEATHYKVFRSKQNDLNSATALTEWIAANTYADLTAEIDTTYFYFVKAASDNAGYRESDFSTSDAGKRPLTKVLAIQGDLAFGDVVINTTTTKTVTLQNNGNTVLTISGITLPAGYTADWTAGTIAPGASQNVIVTFAPTALQAYNGNFAVASDATSGAATVAITGNGVQPTGIDYNDISASVLLFPNPASDQLAMSIENQLTGEVQVRIYSTSGQLIDYKQFMKNGYQVDYSFDVNSLPNGLFLVEVIMNRSRAVKRFSKQ